MVEELNKRILDELEKKVKNDTIKNFLKDIILFEFQVSDDSRPRFKDDYERLIKSSLRVYSGKNEI